MSSGRVEYIHTAPAEGAPLVSHDRIRATAGVGLEGDRYAAPEGHSKKLSDDRQITLIEAEAVEGVAAQGIHLEPGETRRNVTTRGISLNDLVGRRFRVGEVELEGVKLCEPCQHISDLTGKPLIKAMVHRAGLRALILTSGEIHVGDEVEALDEPVEAIAS
jgi:MOSC domain-containing protein YiiM